MEEEQSKSSDLKGMEQGNKEEIDGPSHLPGTDKQVTSEETKEEKEKSEETKEPMDWFEPLEDDDEDANSVEFSASDWRAFKSIDPEEESLAGESERSGSVAGSEKAFRKLGRTRRKRTYPDEGWEDCPSLGEGWRRKETVRQSGTRSGQSDIYYMSPQGERARSRIELSIMLNRDLTSFEFKNGIFKNQNSGPLTLKRRIRKKIREHSSSESSFVERGEGTDTPDSHHRLTPNTPNTPSVKPVASNQTSSTNSATESPVKRSPPKDDNIKLPGPSLSKPLIFPSINGEFGTAESTLVCSRCSLAFTGTRYDKERKKPLCPSCWGMRTNPHPVIRFRKWIPCGQCEGCRNKVNCGLCRPCKEEQTGESRKRCRKRKCVCPVRKGPEGFTMPGLNDSFDDSQEQQEVADFQHSSPKGSDTENFSATLDLDDEDASTDDDNEWHKRRKRRSCGECQACLYKRDCGACDFCIDKPKFGGSNKKRQKCRLRQCHRQAMSHLLPPPWGEPEGVTVSNRSRPQYTYSRKRKRAPPLSEDEDDDSNQRANWKTEKTSSTKAQQNVRTSMQSNNSVSGQQNGVTGRRHQNTNHTSSDLKPRSKWHVTSNAQAHGEKEEQEQEEEEDYPTITQIYSLADDPSDVQAEHQLKKLLTSLRSSVLPILWYAIMVEGPQLQLVQCSKQSCMTDTIVQIDPAFLFKVTVQKHPLLPTHPLYDSHPPHLKSITEVVDLLLDLDKYSVCHGLPPTESVVSRSPIILERAPTCEFLIRKSDTICTNCRMLCE